MSFYYKGYDINNKNMRIKMIMEMQNPFGYEFNCFSKFKVMDDESYKKTNQDKLKLKEIGKKG